MALAYRKHEAKEWAQANIKGVWIATNTPFTPDFQVDYEGCRRNIRYFANDLHIKGNFHAGMVGETFHQTIAERKKHLEIAVEESKGKMITLSAPHCETPLVTLELCKYAEDIGAEMVGPMNPRFYQGTMTEEGVFQYYKWISDHVNIAIYPLNQLEHGYLMSPHLIARMAKEIPNFVGVKNIAPPDHTRMTRMLCGDKFIVTDAEEENWLMNLIAKRQPAYISSALAFLLQTRKRPYINDMTALAERGEYTQAIEIYMKIEPIRDALVRVSPPGKRQATHKYWAQCLGLAGGDGRVRPPYSQLTEAEKAAIREAVQNSGLL